MGIIAAILVVGFIIGIIWSSLEKPDPASKFASPEDEAYSKEVFRILRYELGVIDELILAGEAKPLPETAKEEREHGTTAPDMAVAMATGLVYDYVKIHPPAYNRPTAKVVKNLSDQIQQCEAWVEEGRIRQQSLAILVLAQIKILLALIEIRFDVEIVLLSQDRHSLLDSLDLSA